MAKRPVCVCVAASHDLVKWQKQGLAFEKTYQGKYKNSWSKSGAVVCRREGNKVVATKINDKYWMYWGDTDIFAATSDNLIDWTPLENEEGKPLDVFGPRKGEFDSRLVEPGPYALLTDAGILLLYNSMNLDKGVEGHYAALPGGTYTAGQILLSSADPTKALNRTRSYFLQPDKPYELTGQVNHVVFIEGMAYFKEKWFLYYGTADSKIAVAVADAKNK